MTGCSTEHLNAQHSVCFFQERKHSVLTSSVDKGIASVHTGKCCVLKEPRLHMEASIDTAEACLGKAERGQTVFCHLEFSNSVGFILKNIILV